MYLPNIQKLYNTMYHDGYGWAALSFYLHYKGCKCAVVCEQTNILTKTNTSQKYAKYWLLLKFFKFGKAHQDMSLYVIPNWIKTTPQDVKRKLTFELMLFFGIKSDPTHKHHVHVLSSFFNQLNKDAIYAIKHKIPINPDLRKRTYNYIDKMDPNNSHKRYCFKIMRNGGLRSVYNDTKTKYLRPKLYHKLMDGTPDNLPGISFAYSMKKSDYNTYDYIIKSATGNGTLDIKKTYDGKKQYYIPKP